MTIQLSDDGRNAQLQALEDVIGASPKMRILTGGLEANCAAAETGTLLCEIDLPADWLAAPSGGEVLKSGTWSGTGLTAGTAAHFRVMNNAGLVCHMQGTVTATGGGGKLQMDNTSIAVGQDVTINSATGTAGNA